MYKISAIELVKKNTMLTYFTLSFCIRLKIKQKTILVLHKRKILFFKSNNLKAN